MLNILMLYHRLPYPPNKGDKMRAYQQVAYLTERHRVFLACFVDSAEDHVHLPAVAQSCQRFEAVPLHRRAALSRGGWAVLRGRTLTEGYYGSRAMWRVVQAWQGDTFFDVAMAFSSSMAPYIEDLPCGRRVLDMNDFDSHKWASYARRSGWPICDVLRMEAGRLAAREIEFIRKFDLTLVVNERERRRLADAALGSRIAAMRTPVDLEHYRPAWGVPQDKIIGCTGTFDYRPNIEAVLWFAREVWPQVRARHADAHWWVVGRQPPREIVRLGADPRVRVTGAVQDVREHLAQMRVYVAPTQSDIGVQTKVLEALAAGRPTVITRAGHDGLIDDGAAPYLVADGAAAFAECVNTLLDDRARCSALGSAAVQFVRRHYDAAVLMPQFEHLLCGAAEPPVVLHPGGHDCGLEHVAP